MTEKESSVEGIKASDYNQWKHHPVTALFRRYLADKLEILKRTAFERWVNGSFAPGEDSAQQCLRGQVIELQELLELPFDAIQAMYEDERPDEQGDGQPQA